MLGTIEDDPQLYIIKIEVRAMEIHLAVDLLQLGKWQCVLFSKDGSQSLQGYEMPGVGGGLPGIGMMAQLWMRRAFSGWNGGDQLEVYLVAMQISWYSYIDTQSSFYFLMVCLQTYILINRIESCLIMVSGEISIASYNCNGLADCLFLLSVFTWLKEKEYNIYCLQQTHSTILD
jgi:hypothetical protein